MGYTAAVAAYCHGGDWLDALLPYLRANRDALIDFVSEHLPGVKATCPQGTYLAWLDCRELDLPDAPAEFFLNEGRVALNDGADFGQGGEGFVRINFGCPRSTLMDGLERMRAALDKLA
jgi:cystathionine beta-lyase